MSDSNPDPPRKRHGLQLIRRILSIPLTILVLIYFLIEDLFLSWLRPLFRLLGGLAPFIALGAWLRRLPPYVALVFFIVPFILLEPVKIFSIFWIGIGHFVSGTILLVWSYLLSLLIVERLFHVMRDQLLSIAWFAWGYSLVMRVKAWAFARLRASAVWRIGRPLARRIVALVALVASWLRNGLVRVLQWSR